MKRLLCWLRGHRYEYLDIHHVAVEGVALPVPVIASVCGTCGHELCEVVGTVE